MVLMSEDFDVSVDIPVDEEGMLGRECLECEEYFKIKPGTGLDTTYCHCPYCDYEGEGDTFWTPEQIEYAQSIALNQVIDKHISPVFEKLRKSFRDLERKTRGGIVEFKFRESNAKLNLPVKYYSEIELETTVTCDNCGLVFSVFGVFARCPDCTAINAFTVFEKSLLVVQKKLDLLHNPEVPEALRTGSMKYFLSEAISVFDGLGKELQNKYPEIFPPNVRNLFQKLDVLDEKMNREISNNHKNFNQLFKMFQVRHLYEHSMGVIDDDFTRKIPHLVSLKGKKYNLTYTEVRGFLSDVEWLGHIIQDYCSKQLGESIQCAGNEGSD
jgi:hypothetical protein